MAANSKTIKRRIRSVGNTRKITKAMELVAGAKMRKAVESALDTRSFSRESWEVLRRIVGRGELQDVSHDLLDVRPVKNMLVILEVFLMDLMRPLMARVLAGIK